MIFKSFKAREKFILAISVVFAGALFYYGFEFAKLRNSQEANLRFAREAQANKKTLDKIVQEDNYLLEKAINIAMRKDRPDKNPYELSNTEQYMFLKSLGLKVPAWAAFVTGTAEYLIDSRLGMSRITVKYHEETLGTLTRTDLEQYIGRNSK
ncbi:MAG: hypothetical protein Q8P57_00845 [Candidatus Pacearchaeota archaeon]|nr:hypothetical protein [Candidatus Pacearchaeota archaeon]